MIRAYNESYLTDAKETLSQFFDYLINDCKMPADWVSTIFLSSGYAEQFERGNPAVLAGMSGIELARAVVEESYREKELPEPMYADGLSAEYWAGWALAEYQWYSGKRFADIFRRVKLSEVIEMYSVYHEMDISRFIDAIEDRCARTVLPSKLKALRENRNISQSELSALSGVKLRSIQMYEQGVNDINKAQAETVYRLSRAIGCSVEDLIEG
ncbi:MAG: helix-turn-helix transcriptional regulator [Firmicutes bacterium]|nr:helix-turn-helix transcriptional regulator [Bacillota bacterium]